MALIRIKDSLASNFGGYWGNDIADDTEKEHIFHVARVANFDMSNLTINWDLGETVRDIDLYHQATKSLEYGDVILEKSGGGENQPVGRAVTYLSEIPSTSANFTNILKPSDLVMGRYLTYVFESMNVNRIQNKYIKQNTGIQNLSVSEYICEKFECPDILTQKEICQNLDSASEAISKSIEKLNQKLHHLEEYKTALIHNAVTKGVDANGILFIKDVSKKARLKDFVEIKAGSSVNKELLTYDNDEPLYLSMSWLSSSPKRIARTSIKEMSAFKEKDEIVFGRTGFTSFSNGGSVGKPSVCFRQEGYVDDNIYKLHIKSNRSKRYFEYCLYTTDVQSHFEKVMIGAIAKILGTGREFAPIVSWSVESEYIIANYLDNECKKIELIEGKINKKITLLLEYKKSLINEAVSGK